MTIKPVKLTHPELSLVLNLLNQASVQGIENARVVFRFGRQTYGFDSC